MRPNKTNFDLSFGHFFGAKRENEKGREQRYGTRILYGTICVWTLGPLSMESMFGCYDFLWI